MKNDNNYSLAKTVEEIANEIQFVYFEHMTEKEKDEILSKIVENIKEYNATVFKL